jgi:hypothetical protein
MEFKILARRHRLSFRSRDSRPGVRCGRCGSGKSIRAERIRVNCQFKQCQGTFGPRETHSLVTILLLRG